MNIQNQTPRGQVIVQGPTSNKHSNWAWVVNFPMLQRALSNYFTFFSGGSLQRLWKFRLTVKVARAIPVNSDEIKLFLPYMDERIWGCVTFPFKSAKSKYISGYKKPDCLVCGVYFYLVFYHKVI